MCANVDGFVNLGRIEGHYYLLINIQTVNNWKQIQAQVGFVQSKLTYFYLTH